MPDKLEPREGGGDKGLSPEDRASDTAPNPFDLQKLAVAPGAVTTGGVGVRKALLRVPVEKPHRNSFVRVHPGPDYRKILAIFDDREDRSTFLLTPEIAAELPGDTKIVDLRTAISRTGNVFLWPVPTPSDDGRENSWNATQREAADRAEKGWIRMCANMSLGAYDVFEATGSLPEPVWPQKSFQELIKVAFGGGKLVSDTDHPLIDRLLGRN
jgi:hypothetical protein